jgi:hypothetical protein
MRGEPFARMMMSRKPSAIPKRIRERRVTLPTKPMRVMALAANASGLRVNADGVGVVIQRSDGELFVTIVTDRPLEVKALASPVTVHVLEARE